MSTTVDERVVEMRFDNKQFEANVQTSLSTLDKLKRSLNLEGAAKGLENVNTAAQKCDMTPLTNAVETVKVKFSTLEVMAVTALANITNSAVNAGKRIVSALTVDPIKTGFQEYETQINAVQTILANTSSKGTTLDQVNNALDELNHYADMTIYNFTEMTRNIGTFTAAGVDLDTSVSAIKGIANLAAVSGSTSQQASTAMYQLSQALAAGTVKLQDWNSVVNAGMGGQVFQDALKETAKVHGIAIDEMIKDEGSFRETLSKGWLSSEILTETLSKFTGDLNEEQLRTMGYTDEQIQSIIKMGQTANDAATKVKTFTQLFDTLKEAAQSGWTQSWEIIVGDFEEAKELLTEISDTFSGLINASADARNNMLQDWKDLGGRTMMIEAVKNVFEGLLSVAKPVREAFNEIFPPMTGKQLADITEKVRDLTAKFKMGEETSKNLKSTFKGVFAVLDIGAQAFKAVAGGVADLISYFIPAGNGILSLTGNFGEFFVSLDETVKSTDVFGKTVSTVVNIIKTIGDGVKIAGQVVADFGKKISEKYDFNGIETFKAFLDRIYTRMHDVVNGATSMKDGVTTAFDLLGDALEKCKFLKVMKAIWNGIKTIASGIIDAFGTMISTLTDKLGNTDFNGVLDFLNAASIGGIAVAITKFLSSVSKPFEGFGSILEGFKGIFEGVTGVLDGVRGCFEAYQTKLKADSLMKIAVAIGILAASIVAISLIDSDKLSASLGSITVLFGNLLAAMAIYNTISGSTGKVSKANAAMIAMSVSVLILASALKKLSDLQWDELARGLTGVAGLTVIVVVAAKAISGNSQKVMKGATSLVIFAAAIKILASACKDLSVLDWDELGRGLTGVGVLMGEVALFLKVAKFQGKAISTATGIVILAAAMKILASACNDFGSMQWDIIGRGLTAMSVALGEVAIAVKLMPKNMVSIGTGFVIVGVALEILANAMSKFGNMQWNEIGRGLTVLGISMAELAIGLNLMKGTLSGSAAMLAAAAALVIITPVLTTLGHLSWEEIAKGLVSIAGAFTVMGVAGAVLGPLVPAILGLAGAFTLIGVGILALGAGLLAAGAGLAAVAFGLTALAAAGAAGATAIVAALTVIVTGIIGLIPAILEQIGYGIIAVCKVIAEGVPVIGEAIKAIVLTVVDVLVECVPQIADGALKTIAGVLAALVQYTPQIIDSIFEFLIAVLEGIANNLPSLIKAAVDVLMAFFAGIADALSGIDTDTLLKGIIGVGLLSAIMVALAAVASLAPGAMVGVLAMGAVIAELALVLAAVGALAQLPGLSWLIGEGGKLLQGIGTAIGQFVGGIVGGFMSGVSSQFQQIGADLSAFMTNVQPFLDGASQIRPSMMDGVKALAETILILTAADILQGLTSWLTGGSSLSSFGNQLVPFGESMRDFSLVISDMDGEVVANAATAGKALAEMAATIPNSGGVVGFFAGENDMRAFGKQLVSFGDSMKKFGDSIKGLDANAVTEAATAGKAMAELANTIPNTGGVVSFFTGGNDIDTFGAKLATFGKAMKDYADAISGMDVESVVNSATAGKAIVELANTLPNTGGLVSWFTGDNDIGAFGQSLVSFGKNFKDYSAYMADVDAGIVTATTNAASSIVELQKSLPKDGGWFADDTTLSEFGSDMSSFGLYFGAFYNSISGIDTGTLSGVITQVNRLVDMAKGMVALDISGMNSFGTALMKLGQVGIDGFMSAFTNCSEKAYNATSTMIGYISNGIIANQYVCTLNMTTLVTGILEVIRNKYTEFYTTGSTIMTNLINGIKSKDLVIKSIFTLSISGALTSIKEKYQEFYNAGAYLVQGFINGIADNIESAAQKSAEMAAAAADAAKRELDEHSPSKVGYKIGDYFGVAFVNAISDYEDASYNAGRNVAYMAKNGLSSAVMRISDLIDSGIDTEPTIRPVLDLSDVENKAVRLNALLSRTQAVKAGAEITEYSHRNGRENQNGIKDSNGNTYTFTQNNYSPKALSRVDIYRQTKNQFSAMKEVLT